MSRDIVRTLGDGEEPGDRAVRHRGWASSCRCRAPLRRLPALGGDPPGPASRRWPGGSRARVSAPALQPCRHRCWRRLTDHRAATSARAGRQRRRRRDDLDAPRTRRTTCSFPRDDPPDPPCEQPGHPATPEAPPLLMAPLRSRPAQRDVAVRLHPLATRHRRRRRDPRLPRRPLAVPSRPARVHPGHRARRDRHVPGPDRHLRSARRDAHRQRHGLHHPLRPGTPRAEDAELLREHPGRPPRPPAQRRTEPPPDAGQDRTLPPDPQTLALRPPPTSPTPRHCRTIWTPSGPGTTPSGRTVLCAVARPQRPTRRPRKPAPRLDPIPPRAPFAPTASTATARSPSGTPDACDTWASGARTREPACGC